MELSKEVQERIKADAKKAYPVSWQYQERIGYIAGATAEHERAQVLVDTLEWFKQFGNELTIKFIDKVLQQWKEGKEVGNE